MQPALETFMHHQERRRAMASALVGHMLEWYDFGVYAFVAVNIAQRIFPSESRTASLLAAFLAFGVGFLSRPLGGIVLGWVGDRYGPKASLVSSFSIMGLSTLAIGCIPAYETIGLLAPLLMVICRLLQGLSAGGEYAASATYMVGWAPPGRRGLYGSIQHMGSGLGALLGSGVGWGVAAALGPTEMQVWGWRVPFLLGGVMLVVGLYIRHRAQEAPEVPASAGDRMSVNARSDLARALRLVAFAGMWAVPYYATLFYLPTFFQRAVGIAQKDALLVSTLGLVAYVVFVPLAGVLSDRFGRRPVIGAGCVAGALLAPLLLSQTLAAQSVDSALLTQLVLNLCLALISGPAPTTIVEMFPPRRMLWMSGAYGIALAIFGGFSPAAMTWASGSWGSPIAPAYLLSVACVLLAAVVFRLEETSDVGRRRPDGTPRVAAG